VSDTVASIFDGAEKRLFEGGGKRKTSFSAPRTEEGFNSVGGFILRRLKNAIGDGLPYARREVFGRGRNRRRIF
jgi:hypothetical protein